MAKMGDKTFIDEEHHFAMGIPPWDANRPFEEYPRYKWTKDEDNMTDPFVLDDFTKHHNHTLALSQFNKQLRNEIIEIKNMDEKNGAPTKWYPKYNDRMCVTIGPCGLDYRPATLNLVEKRTQKMVLPLNFKFAEEFKLPLYLVAPQAEDELYSILQQQQRNKTQ